MSPEIKRFFPALVITQGLHSVEEYLGKLWETFPPAKYFTSLFSTDQETSFVFINSVFFIFGLWCIFFLVRRNSYSARLFIWFWVIIEIINGIGHPVWAIYKRSYEPGLITATFLLILALYLAKKLLNSARLSD